MEIESGGGGRGACLGIKTCLDSFLSLELSRGTCACVVYELDLCSTLLTN